MPGFIAADWVTAEAKTRNGDIVTMTAIGATRVRRMMRAYLRKRDK